MLQLLNLALEKKVTMSQIACLFYLKNKIKIPEIYKPRLAVQRLQAERLVDSQGKLTDRGKAILKSFEDLFEGQRKKTVKEVLGETYKDQIQVFYELYPRKNDRGRILTTGCSNENLTKAFEWFFKTYPDYDWDTIFRATKAYVDNVDRTYIKDMKYFIRKQDADKSWDSTLAAWCSEINREDEDNTTYDLDKDVRLL